MTDGVKGEALCPNFMNAGVSRSYQGIIHRLCQVIKVLKGIAGK
jgi:hypothetical protein